MEKRNEDFHSIYSGLTFSKYDKEAFFTPIIVTKRISNFDKVFWMGDLNFRLEVDPQDLSSEQIAQQVSKQQFSKLLALDQLSLARSNGDAFSELNETLPNFPPTYKYR